MTRARRAGADGHARDRPRALGLGRDRAQSVLLPRRGRRRQFAEAISTSVRKAGSSIGAVIEIVAEGVPAGWGAPIYGKLDAELAAALMAINAVKGVEIGDGFAAAALSGEENADEMRRGNDGRPRFPVQPRGRRARRHLDRPADRGALRREADILDPCAAPHRDARREETEIVTKGRHDPCVGIRAVPVGEAMVACVLADAFLRHRGQVGG